MVSDKRKDSFYQKSSNYKTIVFTRRKTRFHWQEWSSFLKIGSTRKKYRFHKRENVFSVKKWFPLVEKALSICRNKNVLRTNGFGLTEKQSLPEGLKIFCKKTVSTRQKTRFHWQNWRFFSKKCSFHCTEKSIGCY